MYESHFGLTGPPFQLNPDPAFFYDSRGHRHALSYMKYGAHQGEGFIVVTGEIGAGKTTVVRALLQTLDQHKVVAAQIVSTQLASGDLLRAILIAFGIPVAGDTKAQLISTIEAFLTTLAAEGRRALLIIDEAQNLGRESIEELRMLSNFQLGNHTLMQSFLIGQPELRTLLKSRTMEQLRQRITASCHLEALDCLDTRKYIEHRLKHVGWSGTPEFTIAAYERIHATTGGVPRRINRLCNRLLLAAYLGESNQISETLVLETADELRLEVGDLEQVVRPAAARPETEGEGRREGAAASSPPPRAPNAQPLLCLCDSPAGYWKLVALARALTDMAQMPSFAIVHTGGERAVGKLDDFAPPASCSVTHLGIAHGDYAQIMSTATPLVDGLLSRWAPSAVVVTGCSDAALAAALLAAKRGIPVVRLDAGQRRSVPGAHNLNSRLLDRLADELHTASAGDSHILIREGAASDHVHFIGSLPTRFLDAALGQMPGAGKVLEDYDLDAAQMLGRYGLIGWRCPPFGQAQAFVRMVLPVLRALGKEIPLVWPVRPTERTSLIVAGVNQQLAEAGVTVVREHGYIESLGLLRHARCLVAEDFGDLVEEAQALGRTHIVAGPDDHDLNLQGRDGQIMVGRDPELAARAVRAVLAEEAAAPGPLDADPATGNASLRLARWLLEWLGHEPRGTAHNVETME